MDFYVIPPLSELDLMHEGDRYFCLAQLYKKSPEYREFFRARVAEGKWVTLDNGAGDHDMLGVRDVLQITEDLQPNEVIPPDTLFNGIATIRSLEEFLNAFNYLDDRGHLHRKIEIFACPQGNTREEWLFVYKYMLYHPAVTTLGFSKITVPYVFLGAKNDTLIKEARHLCYDTLKAQGLIQKPIHLLGAGDMREFEYYKNDPLIRSTDSCNTIWSGMNGVIFEEGNFMRFPTPKDYFDRSLALHEHQRALSNIAWLRHSLLP